MGTIYKRSDSSVLWISFVDARGIRRRMPTGYREGEEGQAHELLEANEKRVEAERKLLDPSTLMTLGEWADTWLGRREERQVINVGSEAGFFKHHIRPLLGRVRLTDLRAKHARELVDVLRRKKSRRTGKLLSPRTVRHIIGTFHTLLQDAVAEELLPLNPCQLRRCDLPPLQDADPTWRAEAVYTREEVERLISDPRIPEDRRTVYALEFLTGCRPGEVAALRWRHYDSKAEPLGRLVVATAYSSTAQRLKDTKTHCTREIPVHPTLKAALASWKLGGWERLVGHAPGADDLVVPARQSKGKRPRNANRTRERLYEDLELLGLRRRRNYDARRTFITLAEADGGERYLIRWLTHTRSRDSFDLYRSPPWANLCAEVSKLKVGLRRGELVELPQAAAAGAGEPASTEARKEEAAPTPASRSRHGRNGGKKNPQDLATLGARFRVGDTGLEATQVTPPAATPTDEPHRIREVGWATPDAGVSPEMADRDNVTRGSFGDGGGI